MRDAILRCKSGELSFPAFVRETLPYWRCAAADLIGRWDHPAGVDAEDLVQEMLLAAWQSIACADPNKGDVRSWVIFGAVKAARRWFHRQRGAKQFARCVKGHGPEARYPLGVDWIDEVSIDTGTGLSRQEEALALLESMQLAQSESEREIMEMFWRHPSVEEVAFRLCQPARGKRPSKQSVKKARAQVRRAFKDMAARAANL